MWCRLGCWLLSWLLLAATSTAQNIQSRAESLLEHARQISDIRSPNAHPFHLSATFSFIDKKLDSAHGTYTETWVSNTQWRRDTTVGDLHRVEIAEGKKLWLLDVGNLPSQALRMADLLRVAPRPSQLKVDSIVDRRDNHPPEDCLIMKGGPRDGKFGFCFDKLSGIIIEKVSPEIRPRNAGDYSCVYGRFRQFETFWFPNEIACYRDRHHDIDVDVTELSEETSPNLAQFTPPSGAIELANCLTSIVPPKAVSTNTIALPPDFSSDQTALVELLIDIHGKPQDIHVLQSGGKRTDEAAVATVRNWRFKPATCDGEAVPVQIRTNIDWRFLH